MGYENAPNTLVIALDPAILQFLLASKVFFALTIQAMGAERIMRKAWKK